MARSSSLALALAGCVVEPRAVLDDASLVLEVSSIGSDATRLVAEVDPPGVRREPATAGPSLDVYFFDLPTGDSRWTVRSVGADGGVLECATGIVSIRSARVRVRVVLDHAGACPPVGDAGPDGGCTPSGAEDGEGACANDVDDDCDGHVDCDDDGCSSVSEACTIDDCDGMRAWSCAGRAWSACDPSCAADPGCVGVARCCDGKTAQICQATGDWGPCEMAPVPEINVETCHNGIDDDCDGLVDCESLGCNCVECGC